MKKPKNLITKEHAIELCNDYTPKYKAACKVADKQDSRSTWFSIEELKEYIAYIEDEGKNKGYNIEGIRFYLGSYPKNDKKIDKRNFTTLFLAPTGTKATDQKAMAVSQNTTSPDITEIEPLNFGNTGWPPHATYPNN